MMSGRDYRHFVSTFRHDDADRMLRTRRAVDGVIPQKYKEVDYNKLKLLTNEKKFHSQKSLLKFKKLEQTQKQNKEHSVLQKHRVLWHKELLRLNNLRKRQQHDVDIHCRRHQIDDLCSGIYSDFQEYEAYVCKEFDSFKMSSVSPVWHLREDIQYWLQDNKEDLSLGSPDIVDKHVEIKSILASVKGQQQHVLDKLNHEQIQLEDELKSGGLSGLLESLTGCKCVDDGIPQEATIIQCYNDKLKSQVLQEFLVLDEKYKEKLKQLDSDHRGVLRTDDSGGWSEKHHYMFVTIYDQYPNNLANRRTLMLDRLSRHLPGKNKQQLLYHEDWWRNKKYYDERRKVLINNWQKDRRDMLLKVRMVLTEACIQYELNEMRAEEHRRQQDLCDELYEQVRQWRQDQMEAMTIEMDLMDQRRTEIEEKLLAQEDNEKRKRQEERDKIKEFQDEKEQRRKDDEERARKRLEGLQRAMEEQAAIDRERVKYREGLLQEKSEERKYMEAQMAEEERQKEERLDAIREQVRVIAESDPERLMQKTEVWNNRLAVEEEDIDIQKPMYQVNTFMSNQITSDPRLRMEYKLREAGVHNSDYARQILSNVKPIKAPRRDTESTVFKHMET